MIYLGAALPPTLYSLSVSSHDSRPSTEASGSRCRFLVFTSKGVLWWRWGTRSRGLYVSLAELHFLLFYIATRKMYHCRGFECALSAASFLLLVVWCRRLQQLLVGRHLLNRRSLRRSSWYLYSCLSSCSGNGIMRSCLANASRFLIGFDDMSLCLETRSIYVCLQECLCV